jgi:hypothetical protein
MTTERKAYVLMGDSGRLACCSEPILSEIEHEGQYPGEDGTFIVTTRMNVYRSHHLLNLWTGEVEELWLTQAQVEAFRLKMIDLQKDKAKPCPRMFDLPKLGLTKESVEAFAGTTTYRLLKDGEGHLWSTSYDHGSYQPYVHNFPAPGPRSKQKWKPPELRFAFPYVRYVGHGGDEELWLPGWGGSDRKDRLTICTHAVRRVIEKFGMQGVYFPQGPARNDEKLAEKECREMRAGLVTTILENEKSATNALRDAEDRADRHWREVQQLNQKVTELTADLEAARAAAAPADLLERVRLAERAAEAAEARARKAQNTLEEARKENSGWDWSMFMGGDDD